MRFSRLLGAVCSISLLSNVACLAATDVKSTDAFSAVQVQNIEQVVHDYLLKNPKIIVEAIQTLQKQAKEAEEKQVASIKDLGVKHSKEIFDTKAPGRVAVGSSTPKVILAEFFGYQCPICRATAPAIDKIRENNKDLQTIFIPWTFEGEADIYAAQTSLAVQNQNPSKFLPVHTALLGLSGLLTKEQVDKIAKDNGVDMAKLQQDRESKIIINGVKANFKLAQDLNLIGTPSIFVTNPQQTKVRVLPGRASIEEIQSAIDEVR